MMTKKGPRCELGGLWSFALPSQQQAKGAGAWLTEVSRRGLQACAPTHDPLKPVLKDKEVLITTAPPPDTFQALRLYGCPKLLTARGRIQVGRRIQVAENLDHGLTSTNDWAYQLPDPGEPTKSAFPTFPPCASPSPAPQRDFSFYQASIGKTWITWISGSGMSSINKLDKDPGEIQVSKLPTWIRGQGPRTPSSGSFEVDLRSYPSHPLKQGYNPNVSEPPRARFFRVRFTAVADHLNSFRPHEGASIS